MLLTTHVHIKLKWTYERAHNVGDFEVAHTCHRTAIIQRRDSRPRDVVDGIHDGKETDTGHGGFVYIM